MAVASENRTVVGVFYSMDDAQRAFDALQKEGYSRDDISFIANKNAEHSWGHDDTRTDKGDTASNVAADAGIGAALGGVGGLLLSFAGLAIPGIGPVLAAGPIVAALGGAGIGAAAGGLIGALTDSGVPEEHAAHYAEGIRRGDIVITVRTDNAGAEKAAEIMDRNGAVDIDRRVSEWRERGWQKHDPAASPLGLDEIRREREYIQSYRQQANELSSQSREGAGASSTERSHGTGPGNLPGAVSASGGTGPGLRHNDDLTRTPPVASSLPGSKSGETDPRSVPLGSSNLRTSSDPSRSTAGSAQSGSGDIAGSAGDRAGHQLQKMDAESEMKRRSCRIYPQR